MSVCTVSYGTIASVAITLTSLAAKAGRESAVINNTTNKATDAMLQAVFYTGTPSSDSCVYVYFGGSMDGVHYETPLTGADAACNVPSNSTLRGPWVIPTPSNNFSTYSATTFVCNFFGGTLPPKWSFLVNNEMNVSMADTANTSWAYLPIWMSAS